MCSQPVGTYIVEIHSQGTWRVAPDERWPWWAWYCIGCAGAVAGAMLISLIGKAVRK